MFEFEACEVFKIKEFTFVNDCFKDEHNEEIGHYGQTLTIFHRLVFPVFFSLNWTCSGSFVCIFQVLFSCSCYLLP